MLTQKNTVLAVVDVQGKLASLMHDKKALFDNIQKLIKGAQVLGIPVLWLEQHPEGLGPTIPEVAELLAPLAPISKVCFSCCDSEDFMHALRATNRKQVLLSGIETHVCIYQTARDLLLRGYEVEVVADTVSSRTEQNKQIGLARIKDAGGQITSTEMALFELLKEASGDTFKQILKIVR